MAKIGVHEAAIALVKKMLEIEAHPEFQKIWGYLYAHDIKYNGPNWAFELIDLRDALTGSPDLYADVAPPA